MQVQMQAFAKKNLSLRRLITQDLERGRDDPLYVEQSRNVVRAKGWAKIKARGISGALNIEWDADQQMLAVRAITRRGNTPHELLGLFLSYLIDRHGHRIEAVNVQLR